MFTWFTSNKKRDNNKENETENNNSDTEFTVDNISNIPHTPKPDLELALKIKETKYFSFFFPANLFNELLDEVDRREMNKLSPLSENSSLSSSDLEESDSIEEDSSSEEIYIYPASYETDINDECMYDKHTNREYLTRALDESMNEINNKKRKKDEYIYKQTEYIKDILQDHKIETIDWDSKMKEWGMEAPSKPNEYDTPNDYHNQSEKWYKNVLYNEKKMSNRNLKEEKLTEKDMQNISKQIEQEGWNQFDDNFADMPKLESSSEEYCCLQTCKNEDFTNKQRPLPVETEGYLEIFIGPMFSKKTSKILFELTSFADQRFRCLYINHIDDERETEGCDGSVTTHNSTFNKLSEKVDQIKVGDLCDVDVSEYDYIGVDELQFFSDAYENINDWVTIQGKRVYVASLDGDCYRRPFGDVFELIPLANKVTKCTAFCDICRDNRGILKEAPFTARMTSDTSVKLVGGQDMYKAMCRTCHDFHLDVTINC